MTNSSKRNKSQAAVGHSPSFISHGRLVNQDEQISDVRCDELVKAQWRDADWRIDSRCCQLTQPQANAWRGTDGQRKADETVQRRRKTEVEEIELDMRGQASAYSQRYRLIDDLRRNRYPIAVRMLQWCDSD